MIDRRFINPQKETLDTVLPDAVLALQSQIDLLIFNVDPTGSVVVKAQAGQQIDRAIAKTISALTAALFVSDGSNWYTLAAPVGGGSGITQLTGDVTAGPGTGSQAATIPNDTVTYAKMQNASKDTILLGRGAGAGGGDLQEIELGTNLSMSGITLNAAGGAGASWTVVEQDLGSTPVASGRFTIVDAGISGSSKVIVMQAPGPYTGKGTLADEAAMDPIWCVAAPGSGSAEVHWRTHNYMTMRPNLFDTPKVQLLGNSLLADWPVYPIPTLVGRVKGNVKFMYTVA